MEIHAIAGVPCEPCAVAATTNEASKTYSISCDYLPNNWIPGDGVFHDLSDPFNPFEPLDNIQGATIQEMYNVLDPSTDNICLFYDRFTQLYGGRFNPVDVRFVFNHNNIFDCRF